jgi:hypothetical protein
LLKEDEPFFLQISRGAVGTTTVRIEGQWEITGLGGNSRSSSSTIVGNGAEFLRST